MPAGTITPRPVFYSTTQAGEYLSVSSRTITRLLDEGAIKGFKVGNQWRIPFEELVSYVTQQKGLVNA